MPRLPGTAPSGTKHPEHVPRALEGNIERCRPILGSGNDGTYSGILHARAGPPDRPSPDRLHPPGPLAWLVRCAGPMAAAPPLAVWYPGAPSASAPRWLGIRTRRSVNRHHLFPRARADGNVYRIRSVVPCDAMPTGAACRIHRVAFQIWQSLCAVVREHPEMETAPAG